MASLTQGANTKGLNPHGTNMVFMKFSLSLSNKDTTEYLSLQVHRTFNQHFLCKPSFDMPAILSTPFNSMQLRRRQNSLGSTSEQLLRAQALIPSSQQLYFASLGPCNALYNVFNHPALRCLIHSMIENEIYIRDFEDTDYCYAGFTAVGRHQIPSYQMRPDVARRLWSGVITLSRMAVCAANDCTWADVPVDELNTPIFPRDVLIEWGSNRLFTIPHLILTSKADIDNPLLQYQTRSKSKLRGYFTGYQNVAMYYANWIRNTVRTSINQGFLSETNWGAVWGLSKEEFLDMVALGVFDYARAVEEGRM